MAESTGEGAREVGALLCCLHCTEDTGEPLMIPFGTTATRAGVKAMRVWWLEHSEKTGHTWAWAWHPSDGQLPSPTEAARLAQQWASDNARYAPIRIPVRLHVVPEPTTTTHGE